MRKWIVATLLVLGSAVLVRAVGLSGLIVNNPGAAFDQRYVFNLSNAAVNTVSASAAYSSATYASSTFSTGQVSTGSFTVASNSVLAAAAATTSLTVQSTAGSLGDSIVVPNVTKPGATVLTAGRDWSYGATAALTAASIDSALNAVPWISHNRVGAVIYSTAPAGARYNGISFATNDPTVISISSPVFTGGRDATTVYLNGYAFQAGRDFAIGAAASNTATNLANAINAKAHLSAQVVATPSSADVDLQSVKAGAVYNFTMTTSNSSGISVHHNPMEGGADPAWVLSGKSITIPAHGYQLAIPVLYSVGSGAAAISGLADQTTYYVIPVDANTLQLASSSANAQAGTAIVLASSSTLTAAKSYTLAPLAFAAGANTGFKWQVSNDAASWTDLNVSTVSWISGGGVSGSASWNLGQINYTYLGLDVVAPSAGALNVQVTAQGSYTP